MNIKFIGTGSGVSSLKRYHSSFIVFSGDYTLLVDSGDGISKALLSQNISYNDINGLVISHLHPDHFSGLAALLVQMKLKSREKELDIFVNQTVVEFVKKFIMQSYVFIEKMGFDINFKVFIDDEKSVVSGSLGFYSRQNYHLEKYKQYDSGKIIKFSCSSFLFEDDECKIFYTGDIGRTDDLYLFRDYEFDTMISEVSHVDLQAILNAFIDQKASKLILTHIDDDNFEELKEFLSANNLNDGKAMLIAYDGMELAAGLNF